MNIVWFLLSKDKGFWTSQDEIGVLARMMNDVKKSKKKKE